MTSVTEIKKEVKDNKVEGKEMISMYHNLNQNLEDLASTFKVEPQLLESFLTYWSIRKSPSLYPSSSIERIKESDCEQWLKLIQANHKFRNVYGEEVAQELIKIIQDLD